MKSDRQTTPQVGVTDVPGDVSDADLLRAMRGTDSRLAEIAQRIYQERYGIAAGASHTPAASADAATGSQGRDDV